MPTPTPGSATPDCRTAREAISAFVHAQRSAFRSVIARGDFTEDLIDWIEARDALHAETLRREVQAQATSDAGSFAAERAELQRLVADARAALQHGEERERVMRAVLEGALLEAIEGLALAANEFSSRGLPATAEAMSRRALRANDSRVSALATAQAMKEGTNG